MIIRTRRYRGIFNSYEEINITYFHKIVPYLRRVKNVYTTYIYILFSFIRPLPFDRTVSSSFKSLYLWKKYDPRDDYLSQYKPL